MNAMCNLMMKLNQMKWSEMKCNVMCNLDDEMKWNEMQWNGI